MVRFLCRIVNDFGPKIGTKIASKCDLLDEVKEIADYEGLPIRIEKIRIAIQTADLKSDCQSICNFGLKPGFSIQFSINSVNPIQIDNPPEKNAYFA